MNENEMNRTADLPGADADAAASSEAAPHCQPRRPCAAKP